MSDSDSEFFITVPLTMSGVRLDKSLSELLTGYSRSTIQQWLKDGRILVDNEVCKQKQRLLGGEVLHIRVPEPETIDFIAQDMSIEVVYQDDEIIVINKPAGMVVHPGAGNPDRTLLNGLLHLEPELGKLPRAGIVHRLDKDTTGLLVVAKTERARQILIDQLQDHSMSRKYVAVTNGVMVSGETIDNPIGRHRQDRIKMAVTQGGKSAVTHVRVVKKFRGHSLILAQLETGRTHQIRVHMSFKGYPLVGDLTYGGRVRLPNSPTDDLAKTIRAFNRQALHAQQLRLMHPASLESMEWTQPIPLDMQTLIRSLSDDAGLAYPLNDEGVLDIRHPE
ncbi:MAG: 23S rRNA pseudouridine(1911/1915/1917) synthase RluD [Gammaproteobacteria bacterium]|nr:23S rRNA pseudouridine(1911/1915/1917) synthase RluD [Gammaproteobacteria bacterium]